MISKLIQLREPAYRMQASVPDVMDIHKQLAVLRQNEKELSQRIRSSKTILRLIRKEMSDLAKHRTSTTNNQIII